MKKKNNKWSLRIITFFCLFCIIESSKTNIEIEKDNTTSAIQLMDNIFDLMTYNNTSRVLYQNGKYKNTLFINKLF